MAEYTTNKKQLKNNQLQPMKNWQISRNPPEKITDQKYYTLP